MTDKLILKFGEALPGYRLKTGECIVDSSYDRPSADSGSGSHGMASQMTADQ